MKVIILAGGYGTRLEQATEALPKPLVQVGGQPILWHVMKLYAAHGHSEFIICLGYQGARIREFFASAEPDTVPTDWQIELVDTGVDTMTGGRIKRAASLLDPDQPFAVSYADGVGDVDINSALRAHRAAGRPATLCAVHPPPRFGILDLKGDRVAAFAEKRSTRNAWISGGYFVLEPSVLELLTDDGCVFEREPVAQLVSEGNMSVYRHDGFWRPMDTMVDKRYLDDLCEAGPPPWAIWAQS